ncbi:hypothetical protein BS47DRAFT_596564 [Hydnum rufescens UP504]|uniref:Uncharacterized protein n=1 Tax=Hydnum rufescens UP504 TaxID=1448309 RepID=A0A9P6AG73_9AGAM|nr:hypothetical protein BS47DRAFT_596564 [Hydnum rufescens UP504]
MAGKINNTFATFAREVQYTPPPDSSPLVASSSRANWLPTQSSAGQVNTSYQAGGVPTWGDSYAGGAGAAEAAGAVNEWETRFGFRVDVEAAVAYLLGPVSALLLLILETKNDFIRFHGTYILPAYMTRRDKL